MASVTLGIEEVKLSEAELLAWWRQRHTYVLAAITLLHIAGWRAALSLLDTVPGEWAGEMLVGAILAQGFLLGLWGALGGLSTLPRWGILGLIHLAAIATMAIRMPTSLNNPSEVLEFGILGALVILVFAAALLPLRGLAGWRVDFDRRFYRHVRARRGQLSFMDYAGYSVG